MATDENEIEIDTKEVVNKLFSFDETSDEQRIVHELLSEENLDRKTELSQPLRWSILSQIENLCEKFGLHKSNSILNQFIQTSFRYLISKDRKGRLEYIEALKALKLLEKEKTQAFDLMKR